MGLRGIIHFLKYYSDVTEGAYYHLESAYQDPSTMLSNYSFGPIVDTARCAGLRMGRDRCTVTVKNGIQHSLLKATCYDFETYSIRFTYRDQSYRLDATQQFYWLDNSFTITLFNDHGQQIGIIDDLYGPSLHVDIITAGISSINQRYPLQDEIKNPPSQ